MLVCRKQKNINMNTLLRIDASIRKEGSYSRDMGDFFQAQWQLKYPSGKIIRRDLTEAAIPHINIQLIEAFYRQQENENILSLSDKLIDELNVCDTLLITSALYNFSLPSSLKSYVDHLVRVNKTFSESPDGRYTGLMLNKQAIVITSKGGKYKGTNYAHMDFQDPYLRSILRFIGIEKVETFSIEGTKDNGYLKEVIPSVKSGILNFLNA
jgi:FMN-dependent NADH-azoreductase